MHTKLPPLSIQTCRHNSGELLIDYLVFFAVSIDDNIASGGGEAEQSVAEWRAGFVLF